MLFYLKLFALVFATSLCGIAGEHVRGIDYIQELNDCRRDAYNSVTAPIVINAEQESDNTVIDESTRSINTFLTDKRKVDAKRHATSDEQRRILEPLMATALIYGKTETYAHHGLTESDSLFWHFEILRAMEILSFKYVQSIQKHKADCDDMVERHLEYKLLEEHGGIKRVMIDHWFARMLREHGQGIIMNEKIQLPATSFGEKYVVHNGLIVSNAIAGVFKKNKKMKALEEARYKALKSCAKIKFNDTAEELPGYEILGDEIMQTYMWTDEELLEASGDSSLRPGTLERFRRQKPGNPYANRNSKGRKFTSPEMLMQFLMGTESTACQKIRDEYDRILEDLPNEAKALGAEFSILLENGIKNVMMLRKLEVIEQAVNAAFEGYEAAKIERENEIHVKREKSNRERERLRKIDEERIIKQAEEVTLGIAWTCSLCKSHNQIKDEKCSACFTQRK